MTQSGSSEEGILMPDFETSVVISSADRSESGLHGCQNHARACGIVLTVQLLEH